MRDEPLAEPRWLWQIVAYMVAEGTTLRLGLLALGLAATLATLHPACLSRDACLRHSDCEGGVKCIEGRCGLGGSAGASLSGGSGGDTGGAGAGGAGTGGGGSGGSASAGGAGGGAGGT